MQEYTKHNYIGIKNYVTTKEVLELTKDKNDFIHKEGWDIYLGNNIRVYAEILNKEDEEKDVYTTLVEIDKTYLVFYTMIGILKMNFDKCNVILIPENAEQITNKLVVSFEEETNTLIFDGNKYIEQTNK